MTDLASLMADEPDPKTLMAATIRSYEAKVQALLARVAELETVAKSAGELAALDVAIVRARGQAPDYPFPTELWRLVSALSDALEKAGYEVAGRATLEGRTE